MQEEGRMVLGKNFDYLYIFNKIIDIKNRKKARRIQSPVSAGMLISGSLLPAVSGMITGHLAPRKGRSV